MTEEPWDSYRRHVLAELASTSDKLDRLDARLTTFQVELAVLRVKASVWGLIGGLVPVLVMIGVQVLLRR